MLFIYISNDITSYLFTSLLTKIINKIIFIISKAFIPNDSILVSCSNIIGYSDIRLGYAAIPVYCIGKNIKFDEIKKLMKWTLPKSSLLFTPEQI